MNGGSEGVGGIIRDLGEAARNNPVSAALIGMGALWLFAGRSDRASELARRTGIDRLPDAARDAWEGTSSGLRSGAEAVRQRGGEAVERIADSGERLVREAADRAGDLPGRAANLFDDARGNLTDMFKAQPLAIGAVGLAIGAAIAASLPTTETEAEYFGESSEFIKQKAGEIASEQVERVVETGAKVVDAVAEEARAQDLTTDGLKSVASDLSEKVTRIAEAATTRGSGSIRR